jgi:hypothetical protein
MSEEPAEGITFVSDDGGFSFTLPPATVALLERAAEKSGLDVGELVSRVLNDRARVTALMREHLGIDLDALESGRG